MLNTATNPGRRVRSKIMEKLSTRSGSKTAPTIGSATGTEIKYMFPSEVMSTANIDEETYAINTQITQLRAQIKEATEKMHKEKEENLNLEKSIARVLRENQLLAESNQTIENKVTELTNQIQLSNQMLDQMTLKMKSLGNCESEKAKPVHLIDEYHVFKNGYFLKISTIRKISDLVEDMYPIGHGGEGRVYRAKMRDTGVTVVVKSYFMDCEQSSRIEYAMLILCSSVNGVKKPIGLFNTNTNYYLIMNDDHKSEPLNVFTDNNILSEPQIQHLFSQMVHILHDLRNKFVKHRDVKLENFLIQTFTGRLTIIDFGWAMYSALDNVAIEEVRRSGETLMGTFDYLPPETDSPNGTIVSYDKATVFALGCVLLELFYGYQGKMRMSLVKEDLSSRIERLRSERQRTISKGAISLLDKCLRVNASERFTLDEVISHPWLPSTKQDSALFRNCKTNTTHSKNSAENCTAVNPTRMNLSSSR